MRIPSPEETQAKLDRRNAAAAAHKPYQTYTIADRLEERAAEQPDRPFIREGDTLLSYGEFNRRANQVANAARARGLARGDVVAIDMENRLAFFLLWFGLPKLGVIVAPLNTEVHGRVLRHMLDTTDASVAIVGEECLDNFASLDDKDRVPFWLWPDEAKPASSERRALCDRNFLEDVNAASGETPPPSVREGLVGADTAYYVFTSGTTGLPKAAHTSHARWMMAGDTMTVAMGIEPDDVFYCFLPMYHGAANQSLTSTALTAGASIVVRRRFSVSEFWNDVRRYGITVCQYIGEICRYLVNQPPGANDREHTLRKMMGAGLNAEIWRRFQERFGVEQIFEGWSSTEANTNLINVDNVPGACGRVPDWNKTNLRIVRYDVETDTHPRDENGRMILCGPGEPGEAIGMILNDPEMVGGRFEGYTSREATEKKILRDVFQEGDAWWSSGDLLKYDEDGFVYFVDRIGDTFRWKSENVSTEEVARELSDYPGLELITIYGVHVPGHEGRAGMAAVVMQPGETFDPGSFYELVTDRLPHYAQPLFVRVPEQADLTTTFKLRKVELQRAGYNPDRVPDPLYVRDDPNGTYTPLTDEALERLGIPPSE